MEQVDVLVIGGGPAGLAVSHELTAAGTDHIVVERGRVGESWRTRWDSFCLVTPNWTLQLPGGAYAGPDPDGFLERDAIVGYLERYASGFHAPVREGVTITSLEPGADGGFVARSPAGDLEARRVVVATGTFREPFVPAEAASLPAGLPTLDATGYRNPSELPSGRVLIVGSGQTGCQLAEELAEAGREVVLACGKAPWVPRRINGRDIVWWALESGFLDQGASALPSPMARLGANLLASGHGGGHDLHLRTLQAMGVTLTGRFLRAEGGTAVFAPDLAASIAWGDDRYRDLRGLFTRFAGERGIAAPEMPDPVQFVDPGPERVDLDGVGAVIFTGGFRPGYASWIRLPEAFDPMGFPIQVDGASTTWPGLHFVGAHFQRKRKSSVILGMGEDASIVARAIVGASG